jgi:predicted nucleotidyltransferase
MNETDNRTTATDDERLDEAVRRLVAALRPERIYLFGSRARGDARDHSDYDLLVVVPEADDSMLHLSQRAYGALAGVGISKDILVLTREQFDSQAQYFASLPSIVLEEGRLLYAA